MFAGFDTVRLKEWPEIPKYLRPERHRDTYSRGEGQRSERNRIISERTRGEDFAKKTGRGRELIGSRFGDEGRRMKGMIAQPNTHRGSGFEGISFNVVQQRSSTPLLDM